MQRWCRNMENVLGKILNTSHNTEADSNIPCTIKDH